MRTIAAIALADLLERVRRPAFLLTLVSAVVATSYFMPPNGASYVTLQIATHRGLYNSAWVGILVAMMDAAFLSFAGFYLVKNSVERDRRTAVGAILAATPMTRAQYAFGKFASNLAVLSSILLSTGIAAAVIQLVRAEDLALRPWAIAAPLLVVTLPLLALVAAIAVLFEMIPWLRGGLGNGAYFFLWIGALSASAAMSHTRGARYDLMGESVVMPGVFAACRAAFPEETFMDGSYSLGFSIRSDGEPWRLETFRYEGLRLRADVLASRILWAGLAVALTLLAALLFDRFDTVAEPGGRRAAPRGPPVAEPGMPPAPVAAGMSAAALSPVRPGFRFGGLLKAELRLAFKGVSRWWKVVALGLTIASLFAPLGVVREVLTPIAWVWPLMLWSALGTREARYGTGEVMFSAPHPLLRQLPAIWLAGVVVSFATGGGLGLRFLLGGDLAAFATWLAGAAFIPALALALGVWSGSGKFFEVIYLLLWYAGPLNRVPALDYIGTTRQGVAEGSGVPFAIAAAASLVVAFAGRRLRSAS